MPTVGEHYRPTDETYTQGVYRVVGSIDEVALLRVTDDSGRRQFTGDVIHVPPSDLESQFETAKDPDAGFSPRLWLRSILSGMYWDIRKFF